MIIYYDLTKTEVEVDDKTLTVTLFKGMLETFLEEAKQLKKREDVILERAFQHYTSIGYALKGNVESNKKFLIKKSLKYIQPVSKEMDNLILIIYNYAKRFIRKDFMVEDLISLIKDVKNSKAYIPPLIKMCISDLFNSATFTTKYTIEDTIINKKEKKFKIKKEELTNQKTIQKDIGFVIILNKKVDREEDYCYRGTLFPLSDENLQKLSNLLIIL